jgi:hypothetical protein
MQRGDFETAAAKYLSLRGLLSIPAGVLIILAALGNWRLGPFRHDWLVPLLAVVLGVACLPIWRFYREHYGRIHPSTRQQVRTAVSVVIAVAVMLGLSLLLRSRASWSLDLPVNSMAISFAIVMLSTSALGAGIRLHHAIIWGTLLLVGALPVWTGEDPSNIGLLLGGVAVTLSGVLDHRLFVRTFGGRHADGRV